MSKKQPNILVIMSDQHNPFISGCYGDPLVQTPNIDRLATEGVRMDRCYSASPVCVPSRMSFMTGRRPSEQAVVENHDVLASDIMTWPERLNEAGYHTALIGRMHFEGPDQSHGFAETLKEFRNWRDGTPVESQHTDKRVPNDCYWSARESLEEHSGPGTTFVQLRDERVCECGVDWLRQRASSDDTRPFAAVIGFYQPHPPYIARPDLYQTYLERLPERREELELMPGYLSNYFKYFRDWTNPGSLAPGAERRSLAAYYANCTHLDELVGRILETVDESGLREDTLVIYCSDHGDMIGRRGAWGKCSFYDDSVRVPLIARLSGSIPSGSVSSRNGNLRDLANTFCEIAEVRPLAGSDGVSLWNDWCGRSDGEQGTTESEIILSPVLESKEDVPIKMFIEGSWKLWCYALGTDLHYSLFNLEQDPDELHDRIDDPELSAKVLALKNRLHENWDPHHLRAMAIARRRDRSESRRAWASRQQPVGTAIPDSLGLDVVTPNTSRLDA